MGDFNDGNCGKKKQLKSKTTCMEKFKKKVPITLLSSVITFYFLFFFLTYFAPLLFPQIIPKLSSGFEEFKEFHDFYDHRYKLNKGETKIWVEFGFFIYTLIVIVTSFILVAHTDPGTIPDDSNWKIKIPNNLPSDIQDELFATALINREDMLEKNLNLVLDPSFNINMNDSQSTCCSESQIVYSVNERTSKNRVRYCLTCKAFKPDRSHHCKFCKRCVLKQDHHCPWVGNCIGFNNYKYFLCFIFYGFITSSCFNFIYSDVIRFLIVMEKIVTIKLGLFLVCYVCMIILNISVGIFFIFHLWITLKNYTTYEYITKVLRKDESAGSAKDKKEDNSNISIFNIGMWENFTQVFGSNPLLWLLPVNCEKKGQWNNGLNFKINTKNEYESVKTV